MRNLLSLLLLSGMLSCAPIPVDQSFDISGVLENTPDGTVEFSFFRDYINNDRKVITLELDDHDGFRQTFKLQKPVMATLTTAGTSLPVFLEPGYSLHLEGDALQLSESISFSGHGSEENNFLNDYRREVEAAISRALINKKAEVLDPHAFIEFTDSIASEKFAFINAYTRTRTLSQAFILYFETRVLSEKYRKLMDYPFLHQQLNQLDGPVELPEDYYAFLDEGIGLDGERLINLDYVGFLLSYLDHQREKMDHAFPADKSRHAINYTLAETYLTGREKYYIQALSVSREMNSGALDVAMGLYDHFMEHSPAEKYKESLAEAYERLRTFSAGNPAPPFTMTDIKGNEVSVGDYHGKVVYLKFWASWCAPCMREVPPAAELKERLAGEDDLVFMYVSIDTNAEAWRNAVERHDITGVHMRTPGRERGAPALYNVRWIPTFYIIGRDGNIYDQRPPKPSDPEVDEVLMNALKAQTM